MNRLQTVVGDLVYTTWAVAPKASYRRPRSPMQPLEFLGIMGAQGAIDSRAIAAAVAFYRSPTWPLECFEVIGAQGGGAIDGRGRFS